MVSFLLNDTPVTIKDGHADTTVLQYLRDSARLCGTKEGCASGDCGACTVVVASPATNEQTLEYRAINSCVTFIGALHGKQLITVEHLADGNALHPVQQAMVECHGSQCGFCTPGFIMSLFSFYHRKDSDHKPTIHRDDVDLALSGNLCRCTGYRPIIDAALQSCATPATDKFDRAKQQTIDVLKAIRQSPVNHPNIHLPSTRQALADAIAQYPQARLVAGSTDLALEVTQSLESLPHLISVTDVPELQIVEKNAEALTLGAATPLSELSAHLLKLYPDLTELIERFASVPIRNQATIGGNLVNASPIGDLPPVLLALDAQLLLDNGTELREIPAREFFVDYRKTALKSGEWLSAIKMPVPSKGLQLRAYKVSKRIEDDISTICAVFSVQLEDGRVTRLHAAFGGMAATPLLIEALQEAVGGQAWRESSTFELGADMLRGAFTPMDDVRASAQYRKDMAVALWKRFWLETRGESAKPIETRVVTHA